MSSLILKSVMMATKSEVTVASSASPRMAGSVTAMDARQSVVMVSSLVMRHVIQVKSICCAPITACL